MSTPLADIGLIGLAVMGENLALNMESRGFCVAVYNRTVARVDEFVAGRGRGKRFIATRSLQELVASLQRPRKILMLVKAGSAVDELIDQLLPLLEPGDILIDGGNSLFTDTIARTQSRRSARNAVRRLGRVRRRRRRAQRTFADARRQHRRLAAHQADLPGDLRAYARRRALLRLDGRERRRPLRQDGPQRHRVRRHAADLRDVRRHEARPGHEQRARCTTCSPTGIAASWTAT